jgi:hypothetical protein
MTVSSWTRRPTWIGEIDLHGPIGPHSRFSLRERDTKASHHVNDNSSNIGMPFCIRYMIWTVAVNLSRCFSRALDAPHPLSAKTFSRGYPAGGTVIQDQF